MIDEEEAKRRLVADFHVSRETLARLSAFVTLLRSENDEQNLIAKSTVDQIWSRHILDSAQLISFAPTARTWLDVGTGAGFPGLIIAALHSAEVTMVESRRLRANFLERAAALLQLPAATKIICSRAERLPSTDKYDVISARACAPLAQLLTLTHQFAASNTRWVLPKGRSAQSEVAAAQATWQGMFHVEPSVTDPEAGIVIAERVQQKRA